ncbi:MAG: PPA1309 family protein, partial [Candidatus Nanopelagicales bacterium]
MNDDDVHLDSETPPPPLTEPPTPAGFRSPLLDCVREIERFAAHDGWDRPARLFALAHTSALLAREPSLAAALGIDPDTASELTPIEQEELSADQPLEQVLATLAWPDDVVGCALVVERVVLPPRAEAELLQDIETLVDRAAAHSERQDVRMVVAVLRDGSRECAIR